MSLNRNVTVPVGRLAVSFTCGSLLGDHYGADSTPGADRPTEPCRGVGLWSDRAHGRDAGARRRVARARASYEARTDARAPRPPAAGPPRGDAAQPVPRHPHVRNGRPD